ncbi:MAG: hypothetical protein QM489_01410 [Candidatus Izemoplasma sp.]
MKKYTTNKSIFLTSLVVIILLIIFSLIDSDLSKYNIMIFDTKLFYSPGTFYDNRVLLDLYTPSSYFVFRVLDTVFPFTYGLLLYGLLARSKGSKLNYLPGIVVIIDIIENIVIISIQFISNTNSELVIYLLNAVTILKFSLIFVIVNILMLRLIKKFK